MIFSKDITPVCAYCEHGRQIMSTDDVICEKKGIVKASYGCRRFPIHAAEKNSAKKSRGTQRVYQRGF